MKATGKSRDDAPWPWVGLSAWLEVLAKTNRRRKAALVIGHDLMIAALSLPLAIGLRVGFEQIGRYQDILLLGAPLFCALAATIFWASGLYRGIWRYASLRDLLVLSRASAIAVFVFVALLFALGRLESLPRSAPILQLILLVALLGAPRFATRILFEDQRRRDRGAGERCLLIGDSASVAHFVRVADAGGPRPLDVFGVLSTEEEGGRGRRIAGAPVLGDLPDLGPELDRFREQGAPIARIVVVDRLAGPAMRAVMEKAQARGVAVSRAPEPHLLEEASHMPPLRPIALEDLLGRAETKLDEAAVASLIRGRRVLITGAGGTIGSELALQIAARGPARLSLIDACEYNLYRVDQAAREQAGGADIGAAIADIRDRARIFALFRRDRPELVFHAAALKHVPIVETNICEGVATNALGSKNVADAALACGARAFVQISTDKAVNPANVMGATKRLAEFYCQALDIAAAEDGAGAGDRRERPRFMTVRFGNVLGSSGSVVPLFERQLARGGPLTVTHPDIERFFMTVQEAVALVLQASASGLAAEAERGRIFVLDMGASIKIIDIARQVIRLAGLTPEKDVRIDICGLRPGEKLFEELFDIAERRLDGVAPGVLAAEPQALSPSTLEEGFARLERAVAAMDESEARAALEAIVPGYGVPEAPPFEDETAAA